MYPAVLAAAAFYQAPSFIAEVKAKTPKVVTHFVTFFGLSHHLAGAGEETYDIYRRDMSDEDAKLARVAGLGVALAAIKEGERSGNPVPMPLRSQVERAVFDYMNSGNILMDIATTADRNIPGHDVVVKAIDEARAKQIEMEPYIAKLHAQSQ